MSEHAFYWAFHDGFMVGFGFGTELPSGVVALSDNEYQAALYANNHEGATLSIENGKLIVTPWQGPPPEVMVQVRLDQAAESWGYDSMADAATYAGSAVKRFKAEAKALLAWRDQVWAWFEEAGEKPSLEAMPASPQRPIGSAQSE